MIYRTHPGYRELLARAREHDPRAHVVCSETRDGRASVKLTCDRAEIHVRASRLDGAIDAVLAAMEAVL